uniref:Uncharacterized protein n=1 Tax=Onchocerca volvulus TaxID=6282 RepID=A0A8R1XQZ3_ONCVO
MDKISNSRGKSLRKVDYVKRNAEIIVEKQKEEYGDLIKDNPSSIESFRLQFCYSLLISHDSFALLAVKKALLTLAQNKVALLILAKYKKKAEIAIERIRNVQKELSNQTDQRAMTQMVSFASNKTGPNARRKWLYEEDSQQLEVIEEVFPKMNQEGIIHYLYHHEVISSHKPTTKLRRIYMLLRIQGNQKFTAIQSSGRLYNCIYRSRIEIQINPTGYAAHNNSRPQKIPFVAITSPFSIIGTLNPHLETNGRQIGLEIKRNLCMENLSGWNKRSTGQISRSEGYLQGSSNEYLCLQ